MSAKNMDRQGRWRNKTVAFRVSPEEDELIETAVRLSGLTKQDYIIRRLQEKEIVVVGTKGVEGTEERVCESSGGAAAHQRG